MLWGVALQLVFGLIVLSPALQVFFFNVIDTGVKELIGFSEAGATFVFQSVEAHQVTFPDGHSETFIGRVSPAAKTFAFWILPTIVFFSSLMSILYHIGLMQKLVYGVAWVMQRTMGTSGAETIDEIAGYGDRIVEVRGKVGFNAFSQTHLEEYLRSKGVQRVLLAGCVTSICVNATALQAFESGFEVTVLSDCTSSRTPIEQDFFCENVFPLFSNVCTSDDLLEQAGASA